MDGQRFDRLTKVLVAARPSRRGLVRGVIGSALVGAVGGARGAAGQVTPQAGICEGRTTFCSSRRELGFNCGDSFYCRCAEDVGGENFCADITRLANRNPRKRECQRNSDCDRGEKCFDVEGCEFGRRRNRACLPLCP